MHKFVVTLTSKIILEIAAAFTFLFDYKLHPPVQWNFANILLIPSLSVFPIWTLRFLEKLSIDYFGWK